MADRKPKRKQRLNEGGWSIIADHPPWSIADHAPRLRELACTLRRSAFLVVASSVLYYMWRRRDSDRARWVNKHAWIAIGLNVVANVGLLLVRK
jgi:hypothetical protein